MEGYPTWAERVVLYLTNRARTEPDAFNPDEPYEPSAPLIFDLELAKAARFHARHIVDASCFCEDHSSCCALERNGEDVSCSGPVSGCGAMTADARVALWSASYSGENMAQGYMSPQAAVEGWIFSSGHWQNMNNPAHGELGAGNHQTAWVQDFGSGGTPEVIGDGIHFSQGQGTTFATTYYQRGTGGPQSALVIVDGECHELDLAYGVAEHGAFETTVTLEPGCHRYYFHFTDGSGEDHTYPSFGSLGVGVGEECPLFLETRPADTCSPSGQTCMTGDTRACYTGPFGTRDIGICESGVERCVGGQWTGECRLEVQPEAEETCDNSLDDDCDGEVDEECQPDQDVGVSDAGNFEADAGSPAMNPGAADDDERGCSTVGHSPTSAWAGWLLALAAILSYARRPWRLR
jgi:uncharacterized protein (TIGR03382 family)